MADGTSYKRFEPRSAQEARDADPDPSPEFDVGDEHFVCVSRKAMPVGALRRLSGQAWTIANCCEFIETVLEDKDSPDDVTDTQIDRFRAVLDSKDPIVDGELLKDIVVWVIEAVSDRPTKSPAGSNGGRRPTKAGSKAKPSGKASISAV